MPYMGGYPPKDFGPRQPFDQYVQNTSPDAVKQIPATSRPVRVGGPRNVTTIDMQYEAQLAAEDRRANIYRAHAADPAHHSRAFAEAPTSQDGCIEDKGRGRVNDVTGQLGVFDPISSTWRVEPTNVTRHAAHPEEVPLDRRWRDMADMHHTRQKAAVGQSDVATRQIDPITHRWLVEPDPAQQAVRDTRNARVHGMSGSGVRRVNTGNYDPIRHEWLQQPVGAGEHDDRSSGTQGRTGKRSVQPPGSSDPIARPESADTITGHTQKARCAPPRDTGVYNPIQNEWTVPPQNRRQVDGLAFEPTSTFVRYSFRPE